MVVAMVDSLVVSTADVKVDPTAAEKAGLKVACLAA